MFFADRNQYGPEQRQVIEAFTKGFDAQKGQKIVLYGIGKNTEAVLSGTDGFQFVGLMDQSATGTVIYGKKVLSDEEVVALRPIIVIIARQSVIQIIFKRIHHLKMEHGIDIYDFQGNALGESFQYRNEDLPYWDASQEELVGEIKKHDIISFDIFDTLLMRKVLQPEDVFRLVEVRLRKEGHGYPFVEMRLEAEYRLGNCPDLDEIYENLKRMYALPADLAGYMEDLECEVDASLLLRREIMCEIFRAAVAEGKKVYLLSDMYYPKKFLEKLLGQNGITGYQDVFVSCDVKKEKSDGSLYRWFHSITGSGRKLHIGDNRRADIEKAREHGIDAYHIYSAYELLMASAMQDILANTETLPQRCLLGLAISMLFNNPFVLHSSRGYLHISDIRNIGYCFMAPILVGFMKWFIGKIKEHGIEQVLFGSRDGYLVKKIYELMKESTSDTEAVYFRTSRRASGVAALRDFMDIQKIAKRRYYGTYGEYLGARFGIDMDASDTRKELLVKDTEDDTTQEVLWDYQEKILQNAAFERKNYLKYLDRKKILTDKKQAFFDFVAGGTVQYNVEKLLRQNMLGVYFATVNLPNGMYREDTDGIITAYGNIRSYDRINNLGKYYLFLEAVLVDETGTFSYIDRDGTEVFGIWKGTRDNYPMIARLQEAVLGYVAEYRHCFYDLGMERQELDFVDELFGMLFSERCRVDRDIKHVFWNDDSYDGLITPPRNVDLW